LASPVVSLDYPVLKTPHGKMPWGEMPQSKTQQGKSTQPTKQPDPPMLSVQRAPSHSTPQAMSTDQRLKAHQQKEHVTTYDQLAIYLTIFLDICLTKPDRMVDDAVLD
jgi:hypothetical protein